MIGIIRDGGSDYAVLKKLITCILEQHHTWKNEEGAFYEFKIPNAMRDILEEYLDKSGKNNDYGLHTKAAIMLQQEMLELIGTAFWKLEKEKQEQLTNQDVIILHADAERPLGKQDAYFEDWSYTVNSVLWLAIEKFYDKMAKQGRLHPKLPLIIPFVPFPCIEILIASCMESYNADKHRTFRAKPDLKTYVWGDDDSHAAFKAGYLEAAIEEYIVSDNLSKIYQHIPESRKFIHLLSFTPSAV